MPTWKILTCAAAICGMAFTAAGASAQSGEFDGANYTCLQYNNGQGENSSTRAEANLAHLWIMGYLAGYYRAGNKLEMSADAADAETLNNAILSACKENPQVTILAVAQQAIGTNPFKVPEMAAEDFSTVAYTCGQHVDAISGSAADANRADLAEMWAFAFIQGFKNVEQPDMVINPENKPALMGAITKNCANNRDVAFMELTAMVANAVKMQ